jgi:hypothetical protein
MSALCLYGQPRYFFNNDTLLRNVIQSNDINHVFFHTWWNSSPDTYNVAPWAHVQDNQQLKMCNYNMDFLKQMYNPTRYIIEPQKDFSTLLYNINTNSDYIRSGNVLSQYYSSMMSAQLMNSFPEKYDYVIRARFDTFVELPLDVSKYDIKEDIIIVPDNCHNPLLCNDNFSISTPKVFSTICNLYNCVQEYVNNGVPYLPEELFMHHLNKHNITVVKDPEIKQMFFRGINYVHP